MARPQNPGAVERQPAPWNQWPANPATMMSYHVYPQQGYNPAMYFNMAPAPVHQIPSQPTAPAPPPAPVPTLKRPAPSLDVNSAKDVIGSKDHHR